jgi:hypothetical protein
MGHKNKAVSQANTQYNAALSTAQAESPYEKKRADFDNSIIDWSKAGDYRAPTNEMKAFYNFADPAAHKAQSDILANSRGAGTAAFGAGANPTALALDKQMRDDQFESDAAHNYQDTTARLVGGAYSDNADMQGLDQAKKLSVLGTTAGTYGQQSQIDAQRPKWWQQLLGVAGGVGASAAGGFAGSAAGSQAIKGWLKDGGRVKPGERYGVGEEGPEALVADDGNVQPLGVDGPQVVTPTQPGTVIPNGSLPDFLRYARGSDGATLAPMTRPRSVNALPAALRPDQPIEAPDATLGTSVDTLPTKPLPPTLPEMAGVDESGATEERPRFADPTGRLEKQIEYENENPAKDRNGRLKSVFKEMALNTLQGLALGGLPGAVRGAIVGGAEGAFHPAIDEERAQQGRTYEWQRQLSNLRADEKQGLDADAERARTDQTKANTNWLNARPGIEQEKIDAKAMKDEQAAVLRNLGQLKGQKIDPSNPAHAAFLARAERAKVFIDPTAWNNSKGNLATVTLTDPDDPTKTQTINYNKLTGEQQVVGQKGFQQPVGENGMTAAQTHNAQHQDDSLADLERQRGVQNELARVRVNQGAQRIDLAQASQDHRFSQDTRKELGDAEKLRTEAERYQMEANDADTRVKYFDKDAGEWKESKKWASKRDEANARAESLREQLYGSYGYLWNGQMSREEFLANHPSLKEITRGRGKDGQQYFMPTGEIDGLAKKYGITLTDSDSTQGTPGSIRAPAMPRRGAPSQPRAAAPQPAGGAYTEQQVRQRARDKGKDEEQAVAAARAKRLIP